MKLTSGRFARISERNSAHVGLVFMFAVSDLCESFCSASTTHESCEYGKPFGADTVPSPSSEATRVCAYS